MAALLLLKKVLTIQGTTHTNEWTAIIEDRTPKMVGGFGPLNLVFFSSWKVEDRWSISPPPSNRA